MKDERLVLKDYIEKLMKESKNMNESLIKENNESKNKLHNFEDKCVIFEDLNSKLNVDNSILKQHLETALEKIKSLEFHIKNKNIEYYDLEIKYNTLLNNFNVKIVNYNIEFRGITR